MAQQKVFFSQFPGYFTAVNVLNLPEGACTKAENVVFSQTDLIEPRHGIPTWLANEVDGSSVDTNRNFGIGPRFTFTSADVTTGTDIITVAQHGLYNNDLVKFSTTNTLPSPLVAGTDYYVVGVSGSDFQVSATKGGSAVNLTTGGTGTHTLIRDMEFKNLYYWNTLSTETYLASLKLGNGIYQFVEIKPQDYSNSLAEPTYRVIQSGGGTLDISDPQLPNSPFALPRYLQTDDGLYASTPRGWYVGRSSTFPTTTLASTDIPRVTIVGATFLNSTGNNWFANNQAVDFVATIVRDIGNNREVEGFPSLAFTMKNYIGVTRAVTLTIKTSANEKVRIYRTKQYALRSLTLNPDGTTTVVDGESAPVDYVQTVGDVTADGNGDVTVDVLFNDDVFTTGLPLLYTSASQGGISIANMNPPICSDATLFKGHAVYADVLTAPVAKLQLLSIGATTNPATDALDTETITVGATTFTYAYRNFTSTYTPGTAAALPVEVNPTSTLNSGYGLFHADLGFVAPGAGVNGTAIKVGIRSYNASTDDGDAIPDGASTSAGMTLTGSSLAVTIDPTLWKNDAFNTTKGYVYVIQQNQQSLATVFAYDGYTVTSSTVVTFSNVRTVYGDAIATNANALNFWFIPGASAQNFPLYLGSGRIQASGDPKGSANYAPYYSLVPSRNRPSLVIGRIRQQDGGGNVNDTTNAVTSRYITCNPEFFGATDRSLAQLIDGTIKNLAYWINANATTRLQFFAYPTEAGTILIEGLNFGDIDLAVSAGTGSKYEPPLSTSATNLADLSNQRVKSGIVLSKLNLPELIPQVFGSSPQPVGSPARRIMKLAATRDDLYAFKEREGIYRISIQQGTPVFPTPILNEIVQLDTTVFPLAPESVQVLDDNVYFLSDKGFCRIVNNQVQFISSQIEQDVKTAFARTPDLANVRSYTDRGKRLYVCFFPETTAEGSGTTFVYNSKTDRWSTYSNGFDWAVQDAIGRITTLTSDYNLDGVVTNTASLNAANYDAMRVRRWQYLRQERFTGREKEFVYDNNAEIVVDNSGEELYILNPTTNIVDSSFDQFDEYLTGFGTAVYANGQITVTRTRAAFPYPFPDRDFTDFVQRLKNRQLWYRTNVAGDRLLIPVTFSNVTANATSTSIVLDLPDDYSTLVTPDPNTDELMVGVDTTLDFVPFHGGQPQFLKQFGEYAAHYQDRVEPNSLPSQLFFQFAVDNQTTLSSPITFDSDISANRTIFRTYVPLTAVRGRYLLVRIKHGVPQEYFRLNGHTFTMKASTSTRTSFR